MERNPGVRWRWFKWMRVEINTFKAAHSPKKSLVLELELELEQEQEQELELEQELDLKLRRGKVRTSVQCV